MTPEDFVSGIRAQMGRSFLSDKHILDKTPIEEVTDEYWRRVLALYRSLDDKSKATIRTIFRQVATDTVSVLFGILDGVCVMEGFTDNFTLTYSDGHDQLNGDLADLYLEAEEDA